MLRRTCVGTQDVVPLLCPKPVTSSAAGSDAPRWQGRVAAGSAVSPFRGSLRRWRCCLLRPAIAFQPGGPGMQRAGKTFNIRPLIRHGIFVSFLRVQSLAVLSRRRRQGGHFPAGLEQRAVANVPSARLCSLSQRQRVPSLHEASVSRSAHVAGTPPVSGIGIWAHPPTMAAAEIRKGINRMRAVYVLVRPKEGGDLRDVVSGIPSFSVCYGSRSPPRPLPYQPARAAGRCVARRPHFGRNCRGSSLYG